MRTLVLGASGQTGYRLVQQLLVGHEQHPPQNVRVVVRSKENFHTQVPVHERLEVIEGSILDVSDTVFEQSILEGSDVVVSCLGHNMTFKGMFGHPKKLVSDVVQRVYSTVHKKKQKKGEEGGGKMPSKFILMSSDGVANPNGQDDQRPFGERIVLAIIRALLPPHRDNEEAADYLANQIGKQQHGGTTTSTMEWIAVRPTDLIDDDGEVSDYNIFEKPQGSLFGSGEATRVNVAHFMYDLITNQDLWDQWVYSMPVLLNNVVVVPTKKI